MKLFAMLQVGLVAACLPCSVLPCEGPDFPGNLPFSVDPDGQETDQEPPVIGEVVGWTVVRGKKVDESGCGDAGCSPIGGLIIENEPSADNVTPSEGIGYNIEFESGRFYHQSFSAPFSAREGKLYVTFADDPDERFYDKIRIQAVDYAGNESGFTEWIEVQEDSIGEGCGLGRGSGGAPGMILVSFGIVIYGYWRRYRRVNSA